MTSSPQGESLTLTPPSFLLESNLPKKITKALIDPFNVFATFFLRRSVEKAFQLEEVPTGLSLNAARMVDVNPPFISSVVDDVMYIVNQVVQKSLSTSQGPLVVSIMSTVGRVLGSDFVGMMQRKMRDESYPKATVQGALPPEDKTILFMILLNSLDVAVDYVKRIVKSHSDEESENQQNWNQEAKRPLAALFPMDRDAILVRRAMKSLESTFTLKATDLANDGISVLFVQVVKPRIRPLLAEAFRESNYSFLDDSSEDSESNDGFDTGIDAPAGDSMRAIFEIGWDKIISPMKAILTARNTEKLLTTTMNHLSNVLEKRIWSYQGRLSELGAVRLEKDIRDVVNVTTGREAFEYRETFKRCVEIVTFMNMEQDEWEATEGAGGDENDDIWVLSQQERQRARTLIKVV